MQKASCFLTIFLILGIGAMAQKEIAISSKRYPVKTINAEQGLLNNTSTSIITDTLGYTWVSTQTGLQRYNGYIMETINPLINGKSIHIQSPVYFYTLHNGNLWISYRGGILSYDPFKNEFQKIIQCDSNVAFNYSIIPVAETNQGVYCLQNQKGLLLYSLKGTLQKVAYPNDPIIDYTFQVEKSGSQRSFTANHQAVYLLNNKQQVLEINLETFQGNLYSFPSVAFIDCNDHQLFGISITAIYAFAIDRKKIEYQIDLKKLTGASINSITLSLIHNSRLFVGVNNEVYELDTALREVKKTINLKNKSLAALGYIYRIYGDNLNRIWLLTNDDIKRIQDIDLPFGHFIYEEDDNNFIRCLYYDEETNNLLAGCFNGGIQLYDVAGKPVWSRALQSDVITDIINIEKLAANHYLIFTLWNGWYDLNLQQKKLEKLQMSLSAKKTITEFNLNFPCNIQRIDKRTLLIATANDVLRCTFQDENLIEATSLIRGFLPESSIICFLLTSSQDLWIAGIDGIIYRKDKYQQVHQFHIPGNYNIRCITEDSAAHIWIGTERGLYVYERQGNLLKQITVQNGLLNDCIYSLVPIGRSSTVIAGSNLGLSYIPLNGTIINYTRESGLQENEFNTGAAIQTRDGRFFFGGVNGINAFYPSHLSNLQDKPILNMTKLMINDSSYNPAIIGLNTVLKLRYFQNHLQFDYAAFGVFNTNEYVYKYRLKGMDATWQTTNHPMEIKYYLAPGEYTFEITCSPIFSPQLSIAKSFQIIIAPPWWKTWWFWSLLALVVLGITIFIMRQILYRRYQKKIHAFELEQTIQQERKRISRDLHDNLGAYAAAIASNLTSLQNTVQPERKNILQHLNENSQAIISQLNDTIWALNKEAISLTAISDRLKVFLHKIQVNYPQVQFTFRESIETDVSFSPANALHLFRILQEAVNNALKHSRCTTIQISITGQERWEAIVQDDGVGMPGHDQETPTGNGLQNIRMRSTEAGWSAVWEENPNGGTVFRIGQTIEGTANPFTSF